VPPIVLAFLSLSRYEWHWLSPIASFFNSPKATKAAFTEDEWLRTGDLGYLQVGKWYIVDCINIGEVQLRTTSEMLTIEDINKARGWQVNLQK